MEPMQPPEGDVLATHTATITNRIAAFLFLLAPGALLVFAAVRVGPDESGRVTLIAAAAALAVLGALAFVQQGRSRVVVRADGVERWGLRGLIWSARWSDMHELHYRVVKVRLGGILGMIFPAIGTNIHLRFTDPAGKKRRVPGNLKGMDVLAERITEQQTTAHFAAARARLDAGEEVRFGKAIALDKEKISVRKLFGGMKSCPLAEVEKVSVEGGALRIRRKGKTLAFARVVAGSIPDVFLLLRLLDGMLGQRAAKERDFSSQAYVG